MKYIIFIILILTSCKSLDGQQKGYKVYKIETLGSYYVIYCEKDEMKYKIVSKESDYKEFKIYKKIEIGEVYNFLLNQYDDKDKNPLTNTSTTPYIIRCYMFTDAKICEEEFIKLYTTENLKGLYYIK